MSYLRNGNTPRGVMDNISYAYKPQTNQLDKVDDAATDVAANQYSNYNDIKQGQLNANYQYDLIGNLTSDLSEGITNIEWTVYGKIKKITKSTGTVEYTYDAAGNRIGKTASNKTTVYVRDASGNEMSVYEQTGSGTTAQIETDLYGSRRLGLQTAHTVPDVNITLANGDIATLSTFTRGEKIFELSNHLGNVLVTVNDRKLQHTTDNSTVDYWEADVVSANDYYPFGMTMPGREYNAGSYRYGFNGKEDDNDITNGGQDYGMRIYDKRLGRFLSVDPITKDYPELTPYQFSSNTPIQAIDLDGLEKYVVTVRAFIPMAFLPNPAPWVSPGVKGDDRNYYSVNSTAYRTEQKVNVNFDNNTVTYSSNRANGSTGPDAKGNEMNPPQHSDPTVAGPIPTYDKPALEKGTSTTVYLKADAHDKLIFGAPRINYDLAITIAPQPDGSFNYQVKGIKDGFPAYELWITDQTNNKSFLLLNVNPTEAKKTPWSLWGSGDENYNVKGNSSTEKPAERVDFKDTKNTAECSGENCGNE